MWIDLVGAFLGVSLLFYCLFAGADFGAAILEAFMGPRKRKEQESVIAHAIGPVWEANHVWLILAVVILFNGFPKAYSALSTTYYIPLILLLVGITLRGCAFTFRKYDAVKDGSQKVYSLFFRASGFLVPMTLGMIAGGTFLGKGGGEDFGSTYIAPWLNLFSLAVGLFTCALFAFLAAVYLIGESQEKALQGIFIARAKTFNILAVIAGLLVFFAGQWEGKPLLSLFLAKPLSALCMIGATLVLAPLWMTLRHPRRWMPRGLAALQMLFVLVGWFGLQYPVLLAGPMGPGGPGAMTLQDAAAPDITLEYLVLALAVGCALIFPSLYYLFRVFKREKE